MQMQQQYLHQEKPGKGTMLFFTVLDGRAHIRNELCISKKKNKFFFCLPCELDHLQYAWHSV